MSTKHASSAGAKAIGVGTSHRFQGREFPVVVFDLVEDGSGRSWVAQANHTGRAWNRAGLRVANVAVTRNAGRLYVIGNGRAVDVARTGPLADLRDLISSGAATVVDAGDFLPAELSPPWPAPAEDLPALPATAASLRLYDSASFYAELDAKVAGAKHSVSLWAPFLAPSRLYSVLPSLTAAVGRGVKVVVFTKPNLERRENTAKLMDVLAHAGAKVIAIWGVHEKIVIVDELASYVGSLNALSNNPATGEVMVGVDGRPFARRLREHQHASAFKRGGGRCDAHGEPRYAREVDSEWRWVCPACPDTRWTRIRF